MSNVPPDIRKIAAITLREQQEDKRILAQIEDKAKCDALLLYEPLPYQDAFHKSRAKEVICRKANRTGGTLMGAVEVARAALWRDPYEKYPKAPLIITCLGYGEKHIGKVIHKYLFRPGAFKMIRDAETKKWRTFRPWPKERGGDADRADEAKPAPPLIPQREIKGWSWEKKAERVFSICFLKNGTEIYALNTQGDPNHAQGFDVNLAWFDEDTATSGWYIEQVTRTSMPNGFIRWTAVPHAKTEDMMKLIERTEEEAEKDTPRSVLIRATAFDNPYMSDEAREENIRIAMSEGEDIYRQRILGELSNESTYMYPEFNKRVHDAMPDRTESILHVQKLLIENNGEPPDDWCRYAIVDPGTTVCAILYFAVPPPEEVGDFKVVYDESYIRQADRYKFGDAMQAKCHDRVFQEFIIDAHGGRLRDIGSGIHPRTQYEEELKGRGIVSIANGHYFISGSDDIEGRVECLHGWLRARRDGSPTLLVSVKRCPNFVREMERFKKKTVKIGGVDMVIDEGNRRANTHTCDCAEYGAAHGLPYIKPPKRRSAESFVERILRERRQRAAQLEAEFGGKKNYITLGPRGVPV